MSLLLLLLLLLIIIIITCIHKELTCLESSMCYGAGRGYCSGARGTALPTIVLLVLKKTGGGRELGDVFRKEL